MRRHRRNLLNGWGYAAIAAVAGSLVLSILALGGVVSPWISIPAVPIMYLTFKLWEAKTDFSEKSWGAGARAERKVGEELDRLHEQGFHVFHDWQAEKGNVDHFIIGPQGIFAVETKATQGVITPEEKELLRDGGKVGYRDPVSQATYGARKVRKLTEEVLGREQYVVPIVCFPRAEVRCYGPLGIVEVTDLASLNRVILQGRKVRYTDDQASAISGAVQVELELAPSASPGSPPEPPSRAKRFVNRFFDLNTATVLLGLFVVLSLVFPARFSLLFGVLADLYGLLAGAYVNVL